MTISFPYDSAVEYTAGSSTPTLDRAVDSSVIRGLDSKLFSTGLITYNNSDCYKVSAVDGEWKVSVAPGAFIVRGIRGYDESITTFDLEISSATLPRNDMVVISVDTSRDVRAATVRLITGTPGEDARELERSASVYEIKLADILVPAQAYLASDSMITDTRLDSEVCGASACMVELDTSNYYTQINGIIGDAALKAATLSDSVIDAFEVAVDAKYGEYNDAMQYKIDVLDAAVDGTLAGELRNNIDDHENAQVNSIEGVHGFRYDAVTEKMQRYDSANSEWIDIAAGGGNYPNDVTNMDIINGVSNQITISWTDPDDTLNDEGETTCVWKGTKLVYKAGSYPDSLDDGIQILDSTLKNAYSETGFTISGLTDRVTYYFQLFPYSDDGSVNVNEENRRFAECYTLYMASVAIDQDNEDPDACVTYADDAENLTTESEILDDIIGARPCLVTDTHHITYLDPDDMSKTLDGDDADIVTGDAGQVCIEFAKRGYKCVRVGNVSTISVTTESNADGFDYTPFGDSQHIYIQAFNATNTNDVYKSLATGTADTLYTSAQFENVSFSDGFSSMTREQLEYIQVLFILKYKTIDSASVIGVGADETAIKGSTAQDGMTKLRSDAGACKLFGLENLFGKPMNFLSVGSDATTVTQYLDSLEYSPFSYFSLMDTNMSVSTNKLWGLVDKKGNFIPGAHFDYSYVTKTAYNLDSTMYSEYCYYDTMCYAYRDIKLVKEGGVLYSIPIETASKTLLSFSNSFYLTRYINEMQLDMTGSLFAPSDYSGLSSSTYWGQHVKLGLFTFWYQLFEAHNYYCTIGSGTLPYISSYTHTDIPSCYLLAGGLFAFESDDISTGTRVRAVYSD